MNLNPRLYSRQAVEIRRTVETMGKKYDLPPIIIMAVMGVESQFNVNALSPKGAIGLMQINPSVWLKPLAEAKIVNSQRELYDPVKNIEAGCFIIHQYLAKEKNLFKMLDSYLGGSQEVYRSAVMIHIGNLLLMQK